MNARELRDLIKSHRSILRVASAMSDKDPNRAKLLALLAPLNEIILPFCLDPGKVIASLEANVQPLKV